MEKIILFFISILFLATTCNHPTNSKRAVITLHDTVYKYVPHRAPDSAYLGAYEGMQGPFMMPKYPGSKDSILIEDHSWRIDSGYSRYVSTAQGYLRKRRSDGSIVDLPMIIEDDQRYDTVRTQHPARYHVPAAPVAEQTPAAVHLPEKEDIDETKALWKKLRKVKLPYTYKANDIMTITVTARKIYTKTVKDTIYLYTKLTGLTRSTGNHTPAEPITIEAREVID